MTDFIVTPTNLDLIESLFINPITGKWSIPTLLFNTGFSNPYYNEIDYLNDDPKYQKDVVRYYYIKLKEKWLYKEPMYRKLLKYFNVEISDKEGRISLLVNQEKINKNSIDEKYRKHVLKYIEKFFITKKFIEKALKQYLTKFHIKWYDLFHNNDDIKELFYHKLKKLIIKTINELSLTNQNSKKK